MARTPGILPPKTGPQHETRRLKRAFREARKREGMLPVITMNGLRAFARRLATSDGGVLQAGPADALGWLRRKGLAR